MVLSLSLSSSLSEEMITFLSFVSFLIGTNTQRLFDFGVNFVFLFFSLKSCMVNTEKDNCGLFIFFS